MLLPLEERVESSRGRAVAADVRRSWGITQLQTRRHVEGISTVSTANRLILQSQVVALCTTAINIINLIHRAHLCVVCGCQDKISDSVAVRHQLVCFYN